MKRKLPDLYSSLFAAALVTGLSSGAWANPQSLQYPTSHTLIALQGIPVDVPAPRGGVVTDANQPTEHPNPSVTQDANANANANANVNDNAPPPPPRKERMVPGGSVTVPPANAPPPGGSAANASPQSTGVPERPAPEHGPTPPGYPFGPPQGSYAPAGPSASGPTPGFKSYPQQ